MRKLKIIEHISLDGVIQVSGACGNFPYGDWAAPKLFQGMVIFLGWSSKVSCSALSLVTQNREV